MLDMAGNLAKERKERGVKLKKRNQQRQLFGSDPEQLFFLLVLKETKKMQCCFV